ncbi:TIGR02444 family protein [Shewanella intestini]|uniref:TIGR02444 family protein n=1 Tax=Shewanella intestini TaxID=2017544 RepID=A0ABS5I2Z7_9GAMM|nr:MULTISPECIES: TIGR02444 family protein [Shewanella]MBR9727715.1 TIGR02444 family protein [Shewanella intestini]MRG35135.1 TIGR02444 family protein [Shewanella sp. XMDDZSB0408]
MAPSTTSNNALIDPQLWQYCEQHYLLAPKRYIALQDDHHINVNLLLLAEHLDQQRCYLSPEHWQQLQQVIHNWEMHVLTPFRALRRNSKHHNSDEQYQAVLAIELSMERQSQQMLSAHLTCITLSQQSNQTNVRCYLSQLGLSETILTRS